MTVLVVLDLANLLGEDDGTLGQEEVGGEDRDGGGSDAHDDNVGCGVSTCLILLFSLPRYSDLVANGSNEE